MTIEGIAAAVDALFPVGHDRRPHDIKRSGLCRVLRPRRLGEPGPPSAYPFADADGPPLRLVFVGQSTYFAACSMQEPAAGVEPFFVDFRAGRRRRAHARCRARARSRRRRWCSGPRSSRPGVVRGSRRADDRVPHRADPARRRRRPPRPRAPARGSAGGRPGQLRPDRLVRPARRGDRGPDPARLAVAAPPGRGPAVPRHARACRSAADALRGSLDRSTASTSSARPSTSTTSSTSRTG